MIIPKDELIGLCMENLDDCIIYPVSMSTLKMARRIIQRYDLQIFDSIIVASAVEGNCEILYSEDMRHGLEIDGCLKIFNPFM